MKIFNAKKQIENWRARGLIKEITNEDFLINYLERINTNPAEKISVYCGIDPTARSLHIGHLVPLTLLKEFQQLGFEPIVIIGNATAKIGDPSFSVHKRSIKSDILINRYTNKIQQQIHQLIPEILILHNNNWYSKISFLDFMTAIGSKFTVNRMLQKKSFSNSLAKGTLYYSNFSYILMQAYDFKSLWTAHNCLIQIGGSDQFPNIVFGTEMINNLDNNSSESNDEKKVKAIGITTNLLADEKGQKISKTTFKNSILIDRNQIDTYKFYQFIYNLNDELAFNWLKLFDKNFHESNLNFLDLKIKLFIFLSNWIYQEFKFDKFKSETLAIIDDVLVNKELNKINNLQKFIKPIELKEINLPLYSLLRMTELVNSNQQAKTLITQNAIKINFKLQTDPNLKITPDFFIGSEKFLLLQKGQKKVFKLFKLVL